MNDVTRQTPELQIRLQKALGLSEADFAYHATDLYVVKKPLVMEWLKDNYEFFCNVKPFVSQKGSNWNGAGKICLDIPFAGNWRE